jgi:hypothetical protein
LLFCPAGNDAGVPIFSLLSIMDLGKYSMRHLKNPDKGGYFWRIFVVEMELPLPDYPSKDRH